MIDWLGTGVVGILFVAVIGVYGVIYRHSTKMNDKFGEVYEKMNAHVADPQKHHSPIDETKFQTIAVCSEVQKRVDASLAHLRKESAHQTEVLDKIADHLMNRRDIG